MSVTLVVTAAASAKHERTAVAAQSLTLDQPRIVVGRGAHADVRLPSRAVSDTHCVIRLEAGNLDVVDEASTNGTTVNGQPVVKGRKKVLRSGDRVGVPGFEILVEISHASSEPPGRTLTIARRLLAEAVAAAGNETAPPELLLTTGRRAGRRWPLATIGSRWVAGRGETCEVILDDPDCSRAHAEFERDEVGVIVRDAGSKNGVLIGGRRVNERRLRHGDEIQLGRSILEFNDPADEVLRALEGGADEPPSVAPVVVPERDAHPAVDAEPAVSSTPVERNAPTIPPPPGSSWSADSAVVADELKRTSAAVPTSPNAPAESKPTAIQPRKRTGSAGDWIVVVLAIVILGVSAAALYVLLRGTPPPH